MLPPRTRRGVPLPVARGFPPSRARGSRAERFPSASRDGPGPLRTRPGGESVRPAVPQPSGSTRCHRASRARRRLSGLALRIHGDKPIASLPAVPATGCLLARSGPPSPFFPLAPSSRAASLPRPPPPGRRPRRSRTARPPACSQLPSAAWRARRSAAARLGAEAGRGGGVRAGRREGRAEALRGASGLGGGESGAWEPGCPPRPVRGPAAPLGSLDGETLGL